MSRYFSSLALIVVALTLGLMSLAPVQAAYTATAGDLVKTATHPAIYYIGADAKRHLYVNEVTFWTWYTGTWSNLKAADTGAAKTVKVITQAEFEALPAGKNSTARPGSTLLKFENSAKVYAVSGPGQLALADDTAAAKLFGATWKAKVILIQNGFETDYTKDGVITQ